MDLKRRTLTALVAIPLVILILVGPPILSDIFLGVALVLAAFELLVLVKHNSLPERAIFLLCALTILVLGIFLSPNALLAILAILLALCLLVYWLPLIPRWFLWGVVYLGAPLAAMISLRLMDDGIRWILIFLLGTWITDTMALFGGKAFGRTPLTSISPKKTREGTAVGIVTGGLMIVVVGALLGLLDDHPLTIALTGLLLPTLAVIGDLLESKIKRNYGVKDSGNLFPGHGGMLDRIDSLLLTGPAVWLLVILTAS